MTASIQKTHGVAVLAEKLTAAFLTTESLTIAGIVRIEILGQKLSLASLVFHSSTTGVQDGGSLGTCHCHGTSGVCGAFSGGVCRTGAIESTGCSGRLAGGGEVCEGGTVV